MAKKMALSRRGRDEVVEQLGEFLRVAVLDDPEEDGRAQVLLGLPALEGGGELVGLAVFDEEVDALGGELALRGLEEGEDDVAPLERMGLLDEVEETGLEMDRDLLGDGGEAADFLDELGLGRIERGVVAEDLGELVAHEGAVEALGGVELVAVAHGLGEAGQHGAEVGLGLFLDGGGEQILGERDAAAGGAGGVELPRGSRPRRRRARRGGRRARSSSPAR